MHRRINTTSVVLDSQGTIRLANLDAVKLDEELTVTKTSTTARDINIQFIAPE